jgi:hypothetical protein
MRTVTLKTADIPVFTRFALLGWHMAAMQAGESVRFHQFRESNSNGDELIASPYQREKLHEAASDLIGRLSLPLRLRTEGVDLIVEHMNV